MYEILPEIWKLMNQLMTSIFLLTTNLSWWLMKQEKVLTVLTVSNFIEFDLFRVDSNLKGFISRRINNQHKLVYQVDESEKNIKILKMWTHYE